MSSGAQAILWLWIGAVLVTTACASVSAVAKAMKSQLDSLKSCPNTGEVEAAIEALKGFGYKEREIVTKIGQVLSEKSDSTTSEIVNAVIRML